MNWFAKSIAFPKLFHVFCTSFNVALGGDICFVSLCLYRLYVRFVMVEESVLGGGRHRGHGNYIL